MKKVLIVFYSVFALLGYKGDSLGFSEITV